MNDATASEPSGSGQSPALSRAMWRRIIPALISVGLVVWLISRVPLARLVEAASQVDWRVVAPLTVLLVIALFLWDALCVGWVFAQPDCRMRYSTVLRARGSSYLAGAVNYSLGQGLLAWLLSRALGISFLSALSRLLLIAYHDLWLLLSLGFLGAWEGGHALGVTGTLCGLGLGILAAITAVVRFIPRRWSNHLQGTRWAIRLDWWSWDRSLRLFAMRLMSFGMSGVYAVAGLSLSHVSWNVPQVLRAISLIQLAEALPITVSGLGTRETLLLTVLKPARPEQVLALGFVWSAGLIIGRLALGLVPLVLSGGSVSPRIGEDTLADSNSFASMKRNMRL